MYDMYDDVTKSFRELMIRELANNFDKGDRDGPRGWMEGINDKGFMNEIYYHAGKLQAALKEGKTELIVELCADIANLAMMCCDKHYQLAPYPSGFGSFKLYFEENFANINPNEQKNKA